MDFTHYSDTTVQMAVDLVNTHNPSSSTPETADRLVDLDGLKAYLDPFRDEWHDEDWAAAEPDEHDLLEVRALRERLRGVFAAGESAAAAEILNEVLRDTSATPRISHHGDHVHMHFEPGEGRLADWLGATTAMGLSVVLCDYGYERFGTCDSSTCDDAYIDTSRNRSRRHCSSTCTTRENVAAHRKRAKSDD